MSVTTRNKKPTPREMKASRIDRADTTDVMTGWRKLRAEALAKSRNEAVANYQRFLSCITSSDFVSEIDYVINQHLQALIVLNELRDGAGNGDSGRMEFLMNLLNLCAHEASFVYVKKYMEKGV